MRISCVISVPWLFSLFNRFISVTAAVWDRFNGEPVAVYGHISFNELVGTLFGLDAWIVMGDKSDGGGCWEFGIEGDDDNKSVICVGFVVFNVSVLTPLEIVVCGFADAVVVVAVVLGVVDCWTGFFVVDASCLGEVRIGAWWNCCCMSVVLFGIIWASDNDWVGGGIIVGSGGAGWYAGMVV